MQTRSHSGDEAAKKWCPLLTTATAAATAGSNCRLAVVWDPRLIQQLIAIARMHHVREPTKIRSMI